jgi:hypothetical protein
MSAAISAPSVFPTEARRVLLPGPAGVLEAECDVPRGAPRAAVAIVCHPHPLHGGSMRNKVVTTIARKLAELGLATVRFNFRGVGASEGAYDDGRGETDDLLAVAAWLGRVCPDHALWLAGFSFGSYVALRAAPRLPVRQMILVAPPVSRWDFAALPAPGCPWLVVQGEADEIVDPQAVFAWVAAQAKPPTLVRMPDTGHFFHRRLIELGAAIEQGVHDHLPALAAAHARADGVV